MFEDDLSPWSIASAELIIVSVAERTFIRVAKQGSVTTVS